MKLPRLEGLYLVLLRWARSTLLVFRPLNSSLATYQHTSPSPVLRARRIEGENERRRRLTLAHPG
jgi:hypothetical protein